MSSVGLTIDGSLRYASFAGNSKISTAGAIMRKTVEGVREKAGKRVDPHLYLHDKVIKVVLMGSGENPQHGQACTVLVNDTE